MFDLHTHSNASDGTDSPAELINKAHATGLAGVALTDHDTIQGWAEAVDHLRPGMSLILGSEISCQTTDGISVHMLGLLFDPLNQPLQETLAQTRENRIGRMERIIARLNEAGYEITMSDVLAQLSDDGTLGRPHLADALIANNFVASREEAFEKLLHNESKFYIPHFSPTPEEIIKLIKGAGGVAIIAHPFASLRGRIISTESFAAMADAGLDGVEVSHRDHTIEQRALLADVAKEYDIVQTGSSDYHGNGKLNELGEFTTSREDFERLESRADKRRVIRA